MSNEIDPYRQQMTPVGGPHPTAERPTDPYREQMDAMMYSTASPWEIQQGVGETGLETFAKSVAGGAASGAAATYGAIKGAQIGRAGGAIGTAAGAVGGLVVGSLVGEGIRAGGEELGVLTGDVYELPVEERPLAAGGETLGFMLGGIRAPFMIANRGLYSQGTGRIGKWFNEIINSAVRNPKAFTGKEVLYGTSAALAGAGATAAKPDDPLFRMGAEVVGGAVPDLSGALWRFAGNTLKRAWVSMSPAARENEAMAHVFNIMREYGDDPVLAARLIREIASPEFRQKYMAGAEGGQLTAAQRSGQMSLIAIENGLKRSEKVFAGERQTAERETLDAIRELVNVMAYSGDKQAMKAAAEIKTAHVRALLHDRLNKAKRQTEKMAAEMTVNSPDDWGRVSEQSYNMVKEALDDARALEREYWSMVPEDLPAEVTDFRQTWRYWKNELQEFQPEDIPTTGSRLAARLVDEEGNDLTPDIEISTLMKARSALLDEAQKAAVSGDMRKAKAAGDMAESVMTDIDKAMGGNPAYDEARAYSRELNDVFTRSFVGQAMARGRFGQRVPPELMIQKALAGGATARDMKLKEIKDATEFMVKYAPDEQSMMLSQERLNTVLESQERILRLMAEDTMTIDPATGSMTSINPERLAKFIRQNDSLLERFPELKTMLSTAAKSENDRRRLEGIVKGRVSAIENRGTFAKLVKGNPVIVAQQAAMGRNPEQDIRALVNIAKKGTSGVAMDGLRAATIEGVMRASMGDNYTLNLDKFFNIMTQKAIGSDKSLSQIMLNTGMIDKSHFEQIQKLGELVGRITKARTTKVETQKMETETGLLLDGLIRWVGIQGAKGFQNLTGGGGSAESLMMAAAGSRISQHIFTKIPNAKVHTVLSDLFANPDRLADLLEAGPKTKGPLDINRQMHLYLFTSGILNMPDFVEQEIDTRLAP